eukprot:4701893-Lingulodinium_polyedra.AAC.1
MQPVRESAGGAAASRHGRPGGSRHPGSRPAASRPAGSKPAASTSDHMLSGLANARTVKSVPPSDGQ